MKKRIYGIETEYGLLIKDNEFRYDPVEIANRIKNHVFSNKMGVLDLHYRANDEPPGNGGFLANGGRLYLDMGHLEYASPECSNLVDLITYDRAGDQLVQDAVEDLGWSDQVAIIKNNVDLETNATFGCHENYLVSRSFPFDERDNLKILSAFLVTRQIYCGAGRIGACNPHPFRDWDGISMEVDDEEQVDFQISQRADHIPNEFYRWVQYNRAIVNTRDEPLSDPSKYRRIHLLVGDSNMSEFATAMKMGVTGLMLDLVDQGFAKREWILAESVGAMRSISRDQDFKWEITMRDGNRSNALELQLDILDTAKKYLGGSTHEADWILTHWESVLKDIPKGPEALLGRVDWASKYWMLSEFKKEENIAWQDPWLKSQDLEYHNLNRQSGLYWGLEESGDAFRKTSDAAIAHSKTNPPKGTRADGRGELIRALMGTHAGYLIDWIGFRLSKNEEPFLMLDPFVSYKSEIRSYLESMDLLPPAEEQNSL
ncbi:MAG: Pup--protein ligase [Nitrospinaceae bacterium]|nr:MAG: Pup--protein ligase [Nitrospinaceae bacterium]